jgi:hypothetical protein
MIRGCRRAQPPATVFQPFRLIRIESNPKGCQTVAGGRSQAKTSGVGSHNEMHPEGMPESLIESTTLWHPCWVRGVLIRHPGVSPLLDPRLLSFNPSG